MDLDDKEDNKNDNNNGNNNMNGKEEKEEMEEELSSSSDEDSSSDDSENEIEVEKTEKISEEEYLQAQSNVDLYPFYYEVQKRWVEVVRMKHGKTSQKLRETREKMQKIFPFNDELWLVWLEDEISLFNQLLKYSLESTVDQKLYLKRLVEKSQEDYLCLFFF